MHDDLPFEGVKILDLSQGVAGPYCGMHLARNGADVIKLEPPGSGCWSRQLGKSVGDHTAHSVVVHRGKRSIALDLKSADGLEIAQKLASECDVFIQELPRWQVGEFWPRLRDAFEGQPASGLCGGHGGRADRSTP